MGTGGKSIVKTMNNPNRLVLTYAANLTEEYVEFNKGDVSDPATLGG